ncbi:hypothetical protein M440DRAFT_89599 [Trichoderma longibrachiatum ATCC 18648]|uniref:Uncharacterized protein n=1 Tax=Trichoderma longibrachiatum ATCC 18648 TaxID=983965 RepID=A0A2T4CJ94_TRILO|nr:hypothetical protein M440DRAFT_89599 [Trichoderma longibrachiatum ATCC 18648]
MSGFSRCPPKTTHVSSRIGRQFAAFHMAGNAEFVLTIHGPELLGQSACVRHSGVPCVCRRGKGTLFSSFGRLAETDSTIRATLLFCACLRPLGAVTTGCLSRTTAGLGSCKHPGHALANAVCLNVRCPGPGIPLDRSWSVSIRGSRYKAAATDL